MSRWAHLLHAFGRHRWEGKYNPPSKRLVGGWVLKLVYKDCGVEQVTHTWGA